MPTCPPNTPLGGNSELSWTAAKEANKRYGYDDPPMSML